MQILFHRINPVKLDLLTQFHCSSNLSKFNLYDKIKKHIALGIISLFMLTSNTIPASASVEYELIKQCQTLKELSLENQGLYFEEIDGYTYIKDKYGNIQYGWSYDNIGNLYYTEEGSESGIIKSDKNGDGISFDENGLYINPSMINIEKNLNLSKRFEDGESLHFNSLEVMSEFFEYYSIQYSLRDSLSSYPMKINDNGTYTIQIPEEAKYNRDELKDQIITKFGPIEGDNDYEKILRICKNIGQHITYDLSYIEIDIKESIEEGKGVCRQYAKIAKVLLDEEGIQNELMLGTMGDISHIWLRCYIDGTWIYMDPTVANTIWWNYGNMPYETFTDYYIPKTSITIDY